MRVLVLTLDPEHCGSVLPRLQALFPHEILSLEYIYPSIEFEDDPAWDSSIEAAVQQRLAAAPVPVRLVHVKPADFLRQALGPQPPALAVLAYQHWSERVAMTANMLAMRQFPVLLLGHDR